MLFLFPIGPVISLVLDFKSSSEPRTLLKDILTKKLSEKNVYSSFYFLKRVKIFRLFRFTRTEKYCE